MRRWVKVRWKHGGSVEVTVTLVDGELSAQWTVKSYLGHVGASTLAADKGARKALEEVRVALEAEGQGS